MPLIFVDIKVPFPRDPFKASDQPEWRPFFTQRPLSPLQLLAENRQRAEAEEYRRVSDDAWSAFRPFWQPPPIGIPFFVFYREPTRWDYWPKDEADRSFFSRPYFTQRSLTPMVAMQAENRQQQGAEEYRDVSQDGWSAFRPFWKPPSPGPPPPAGNYISWICGPKAIKTKIVFYSGTEPEKES